MDVPFGPFGPGGGMTPWCEPAIITTVNLKFSCEHDQLLAAAEKHLDIHNFVIEYLFDARDVVNQIVEPCFKRHAVVNMLNVEVHSDPLGRSSYTISLFDNHSFRDSEKFREVFRELQGLFVVESPHD